MVDYISLEDGHVQTMEVCVIIPHTHIYVHAEIHQNNKTNWRRLHTVHPYMHACFEKEHRCCC